MQPSTFAERLRQLRKAHRLSQQAMADLLSISRQSYSLYEASKTQPAAPIFEKLHRHFNISIDQLLGTNPPISMNTPCLPVLGMASCGMTGWATLPDIMSQHVPAPADLQNTDAFVVVARGTSLLPEGIKPGFLCYCSPQAVRHKGDIVYVEDISGQSALKVLIEDSTTQLILQGWLPPESNGTQQVYTETRPRHTITKIAAVVYVKRKL
jgi:repressor LexA